MQPLTAVLAGCGAISRAWLEACRDIPGLSVIGFADLNVEAARQRAAEFGGADAIADSDLDAVLDRVRPDLVFDCTVPEAHKDVTLKALRRGCHVLGEKPMADTLDSAREMVAAAAQAGRLYAVTQTRRYDAHIRRLSAFLRSGALGRLTTLTSDFYIGAHFGGFRDEMKHVLLLDMAIHTFDAARLLTGADPVSVSCYEWNPAGSWYAHGASAIATFELTDGIVYNYRGSWCAEGLMTTWESEWRIIGTEGSARWLGDDRMEAQTVTARGGFFSDVADTPIPPLAEAPQHGGHAGVIRDFVDCVRSGRTPETAAADNIKSLAMVFGAVESAEKGAPVKIAW